MKLEPAWAAELLSSWSRSDWRDAEQSLGLPSVSPTFRGLLEISSEVDVTGYSAAEVQAVAAAVEHLHVKHAEHYAALCAHFKPWSKQQQQPDARLLAEAVQMVADFVDKTLG